MNTNRVWQDVLTNPVAGSHIVQICQNKAFQVEVVTHYIREGLLNGEAAIIIAKPALRKAVIAKMDALGLDVHALRSQGQIKFFDAEFLLSGFLIDGVLEEQIFQEFIGFPIQVAQLEFGKVRIFGEMVDVLWKEGQHDTALQLEDLWNNLSKKQEFSLLCTYSLDSFNPNTYDDCLERICNRYTHLIPMENGDLSEPAVDDALRDVFGAAWNRVLDKLAEAEKISAQMPSAPTTLLS